MSVEGLVSSLQKMPNTNKKSCVSSDRGPEAGKNSYETLETA